MKITEFSEVFKTFSNIYNRIPEIEQNVVVDNDYYIENDLVLLQSFKSTIK
ncbi:Uncharacterised protein [Enterococcus faecium]|nr:hypothetical protein OGQ_02371 [Enterococcus faecium EnGen0017]ELB03134.1 hypothetical protein OIG_05593 [Enterococcus faecium EnGen0028]OTO82846.1 hypothetical protein A5849_002578 [Enterococcus sp. 10F3_DIV0382]STD66548.1 Uncharacterised protein [Enterococcus faecium]VFA47018.1 Uncharacterised protein [Enterococcus faecium]